jgi:hypothetical protein
VENAQVGVFLAYAPSDGARALIDRELYLPAPWTGDRVGDAGAHGVVGEIEQAAQDRMGPRPGAASGLNGPVLANATTPVPWPGTSSRWNGSGPDPSVTCGLVLAGAAAEEPEAHAGYPGVGLVVRLEHAGERFRPEHPAVRVGAAEQGCGIAGHVMGGGVDRAGASLHDLAVGDRAEPAGAQLVSGGQAGPHPASIGPSLRGTPFRYRRPITCTTGDQPCQQAAQAPPWRQPGLWQLIVHAGLRCSHSRPAGVWSPRRCAGRRVAPMSGLVERAAPAATRIPGAIPAMYVVMARSVAVRQRVGTVAVTAVGMFAGGGGFGLTPRP